MSRLATQYLQKSLAYPSFCLWGTFIVKNSSRFPQIFNNVDDIEYNCKLNPMFFGSLFCSVNLFGIPIHKADPLFSFSRIPSQPLRKSFFSNLLRRPFNTGPYALECGSRTLGNAF